MKKSILSTLLTASMTLSAVSFAQTTASTANPPHASPVAAPTYLGFGYVRNTLRVSMSGTQADTLSPLVQTISFRNGPVDVGFQAVHADTSLTEVTDYYWNALGTLGFAGSVAGVSRAVASYSFTYGDSRLEAVFTQQGSDILADLSWTGAALASTAY
jgi:hypothetical protein